MACFKGFLGFVLTFVITLYAFNYEGYTEPIKWMKYEEALEVADKTGKPVFIFFTSKRCPICEKLEGETLVDPEIAELLNKEYLPVRVEREKNPKLVMKFRVLGYPTLWIYCKQGLIGPVIGYLSPLDLKGLLSTARGCKPFQPKPDK